ncbi:MAG: hypothetical protein SFU98_02205 [Leptospiraceae bacterium]|nr:hypothetical protein [Leptospiraceae bacterium]
MNLTLKKSILVNENQIPIGVLISYQDWLYIEKLVQGISDIPERKINNVGGILKKYANPELIEKEKDAWENHLKSKYASS